MTTAKLTFKCPECGKEFDNRRSLGPHRRQAHGYRVPVVKKIIDPRSVFARSKGIFPCKHCDFVAKWGGGLTKHMKSAHPVAFVAAKALEKSSEHKCPDCGKVFKAAAGLGVHRRNIHGIVSTSTSAVAKRKQRSELVSQPPQAIHASHTNGSGKHASQEAHFDSDGIAETTLALAFGRFQGLCQAFAAEFDLPPKRFASRLAELIYRARS